MLIRTFESREIGLWKETFYTDGQTKLRISIQVCSHFREGDISQLEKIQRRSSKILSKLKNMSYDDRLKVL